jgi:membrane protease YdiL (CAAX protease family)
MDEPVSNRPLAARSAFALFAAAWLLSVGILAAHGMSIEEPLWLLAVFGLALPAVALLVCRGLPRIPPSPAAPGERALLAALALFVTLFLAFKGPLLAALVGAAPDPRVRDAVNALSKLAAFAGITLALYAAKARLRPRDFGLTWPPAGPGGRSLLAFAAVGAALAGIQAVFGRGARPLLDGSLAHRHWILGLVLCFVWMAVEAGVVEEVFFRAILQSRLAALARSNAAGIFLSALVFGIAHAPGLWLRGAGTIEGLGAAPSLPVSIAYSITTMGVAGIVFGVLWARTRNWLLVVALHGLGDALANTPAFMATWRL